MPLLLVWAPGGRTGTLGELLQQSLEQLGGTTAGAGNLVAPLAAAFRLPCLLDYVIQQSDDQRRIAHRLAVVENGFAVVENPTPVPPLQFVEDLVGGGEFEFDTHVDTSPLKCYGRRLTLTFS